MVTYTNLTNQCSTCVTLEWFVTCLELVSQCLTKTPQFISKFWNYCKFFKGKILFNPYLHCRLIYFQLPRDENLGTISGLSKKTQIHALFKLLLPHAEWDGFVCDSSWVFPSC